MLCPKCNESFDQRWQCPNCHVRLVYGPEPRRVAAGSLKVGQWGQTPWGRIFIGIILSQGLYHGLRHLCTAGLLVSGDAAAQDVWSTLYGLIFLQAVQALCLLFAGMLAGAGLRQGPVYGGIVGVWNGILSIIVQGAGGVPFAPATLVGQPILHIAFGAAGGLLGSCIWKPLPVLTGPASPQVAQPLIPARFRRPLFEGPLAYGRILLGAGLAIGGAVWANVILGVVLDYSNGALTLSDNLQAKLVTWEVAGLAMIVGSAVAGVGTSNSLKQGLCVGLAASAVMLGFRVGSVQHSKPYELLLTVGCSIALALAGAWLGGSLFPPVVKKTHPKGLGPEVV
jgi:hypothetical protein